MMSKIKYSEEYSENSPFSVLLSIFCNYDTVYCVQYIYWSKNFVTISNL